MTWNLPTSAEIRARARRLIELKKLEKLDCAARQKSRKRTTVLIFPPFPFLPLEVSI